jgi:hypothetical protein
MAPLWGAIFPYINKRDFDKIRENKKIKENSK